MAKSQRQLQAELLTEGWIERQVNDPVNRDQVIPVTLEGLLAVYAKEFIDAVRENLDKAGKVSTGGLSDGIDSGEIQKQGSKYTLDIGYDVDDPSARYWDFVNQGVRGLDSGQPATSDYQFRSYGVKPVMANAIFQWIERNNISARNEDQTRNLSSLQQKRAKITALGDPRMNLAYAIAASIKRKGLKYTGYFSRPVAEYFGDQFAEVVGKAAAVDIRIAIRKFNPNRNA